MPQYLRFVTLDVFTTEPFAGNPLAVVFLPSSDKEKITQSQKQIIAREFNYSETIFVHPPSSGSSSEKENEKRRIDIFTTDRELPFAGHPTIGAASWFLRHSPDVQERRVVNTLATKSGSIQIACLSGLSSQGEEETATLPVAARIAHNVRIHATRFPLSELLRLHPSLEPYFQDGTEGSSGFPIVSIVKGMTQIHVPLPSLEALAAVTTSTGGEIVPSKSVANGGYLDEGWDGDGLTVIYLHVRDVPDTKTKKQVIRTRLPLGSQEDPATGSAASGLAAYLALTESGSDGKTSYNYDIVQGVEMGRRSEISLEVVLAAEDRKRIETVVLKGSSVKVSEGQILVV
jgi:predicted PhzF superfamily epimerase YddE/YHI9